MLEEGSWGGVFVCGVVWCMLCVHVHTMVSNCGFDLYFPHE